MSLLEQLFPGLEKYVGGDIPVWENRESPWSIFSPGELGLEKQIKDLIGKSEGDSFIHPSSSIDGSAIIEPNCYVGAKVEIRNGAYLRSGSWICDGALVGHSSEIKGSILLPGAKAPHFNYVGNSIIGFGANLGAGVKLSNVRNDKREIAVSLQDGSKINSGLRKLGAMIGDNCQLGCNVVTNPGAIMPPSSMISPNETVTGWFESKF